MTMYTPQPRNCPVCQLSMTWNDPVAKSLTDYENYWYCDNMPGHRKIWKACECGAILGVNPVQHEETCTVGVESHDTPTVVASTGVAHQAHYEAAKIQPIDLIMAWGMDFLQGNVIKYVTRYKLKNGLEDLLKARQYLDWLIERESGEPFTRKE